MQDAKKLLLGLVVSAALYGCGNDGGVTSNTQVINGIQSVTVYDKGAVGATPVTTSVVITPTTISYLQAQSGKALSEWSKKLELADYLSLAKVVTDEEFVAAQSERITRNTGCAGAMGMTITVTKDNQSHAYDIPGNYVCDRDYWSPGARDVVSIQEALVMKYR